MKPTWENQHWMPWFAWFPVEVDKPRASIDGHKWVWLRTVWRTRLIVAKNFGYVFGHGFFGLSKYKDMGWVYVSDVSESAKKAATDHLSKLECRFR